MLLLTFPGAPSSYYGDEFGLIGGLYPDSRRAFPMEQQWEMDVLNYHKYLIGLRRKYAAFRTGLYQVLFAEGTVYAFARILGEEELIVAVNVGTATTKVSFNTANIKSHPDQILYGSGDVSWNIEGKTNQLELSIPPRTGLILGATN